MCDKRSNLWQNLHWVPPRKGPHENFCGVEWGGWNLGCDVPDKFGRTGMEVQKNVKE
ncbi:hypothetical protein KI387_033954, partial [Taxus chinensis]